jgi:imidazolonepropionase-like amidohydrolase
MVHFTRKDISKPISTQAPSLPSSGHPRQALVLKHWFMASSVKQSQQPNSATFVKELAMRFVALTVLSGLSLLPCASAQENVFRCEQLLDVRTLKLLDNQDIVVKDGRVTAVRPATRASATTLAGICLPGWIDLHTHLTMDPSGQGFTEGYRVNPADIAYRAQANGMKTLRAGFTTVRDLGDGWGVTMSLRNAIRDGIAFGPRIFTAGKSIATTGGHADPTNGTSMKFMGNPGPDAGVINSAEQARQAVRQRYKEGSDLIKITATGGVLSVAKNGLNPQFQRDEIEAVIATAKDYGFTVAAHAHGAEGMRRAIEAGVTSVEHGTFMDADLMRLMKSKGTWYVPTLTAGAFVAEKAEIPGFYVPMVAAKARAIGPQIAATLSKAYKAGVPIAFGTDAGVYPHGENATEFKLLLAAGVPLAKAVQMATLNAAKVLNESENIGELSAGRFADITVVAKGSLEDVELLMKPVLVVKGGVQVE